MNTSHRIVVRCISNGAVCNTRFRQEFFPCYDIKRILLYSNVNVCCIFACVQTYILICKISHFALSSGTTNSYKNSGWYWLIIHNSSRSRSDRRVAESHDFGKNERLCGGFLRHLGLRVCQRCTSELCHG